MVDFNGIRKQFGSNLNSGHTAVIVTTGSNIFQCGDPSSSTAIIKQKCRDARAQFGGADVIIIRNMGGGVLKVKRLPEVSSRIL